MNPHRDNTPKTTIIKNRKIKMQLFFSLQGEWVWLNPITAGEFSIPIGCRVLRTDKGKTLICDDEEKESWVTSDQILKPMHLTSQRGVDDMITLGDLQEYAILRNLHIRYQDKKIYVSFVSTLLIMDI